MKKRITSLMAALVVALSAWASGSINLMGTVYVVDTLFHNQVGPGTMQTSLWLHTGSSNLRVFYLTIDMTNPYVTLSGVCATDKVAGNERVSTMAERKSHEGKRYFAGINADFFVTSGYTVRGVSKVGTPVGSTVVEGQIFRARNNATLYKNFIMNRDGQLYVNPFFFSGTVTAPDGTQATLGGINTYANESAASNQNKITIYNDLYYGSTDETGAGYEVQAKLADGYVFETAKPFKMVVTSDTSSAGDMTIPKGGYVIHAHGTARNLVKKLQVGDTVTVSPSWTFNGMSVEPYEVISGNPKIVENGEVIDQDSHRPDATQLHPRSGVGYGDEGRTVYFCVVDGRSGISDGVRTRVLGEIMRYAGATEAMNVDGGGSSCLYTSALGVRNRPSDGSERADGNAIFCVSNAPDDNEVAEIRFQDFRLRTPKYGIYTPKFYGYNKYGMLIDLDVKGVTLTCPESMGEIINDGTTFYATGSGVAVITGHYNGAIIEAPVEIVGSVDDIDITNDSIVNDTYRDYVVDVQSVVLENQLPIYSGALSWFSSDESVVTINPETGVLRGVTDGRAYVVGTVDNVADTMWVSVEKPTAHVMPIDPNLDISTWTITQSGGKDGVAQAMGNGFVYTYTGASSRVPKLTLTKFFRLWSLPDTLRVRLNPGEAPVKNLVFGLRAADGGISYATITPDPLLPNQENVLDLPVSSWIDADDMGNYPIKLSSLQFNMNASEVGKQYTMRFLGFETVYNAVPPEEGMLGDVNGDGRVNVSDVSALINMILGLEPMDQARADVNGDGRVNVSDVTKLINIILGIES
ncbi:MAG: phosphodiester glycosidase family protein [Muribaculaceae bacterium]|nr:phosphodiester glycosidase family protein [Muribaculaceae bacterium]